jgi:hypothetical protein
MNDRVRLDQLRRLLDRLERMPASADRDWMLAEVRARAVDVETASPRPRCAHCRRTSSRPRWPPSDLRAPHP